MRRHFVAGFARALTITWLLVAEGSFASADDHGDAIRLTVESMLAVQEPSGLEPYELNFLAARGAETRTVTAPNLTRQAFAASVLADFYSRTGDRRLAPVLQRYLRALVRYSQPIGKSTAQVLLEKTRLLSVPIGRYKLARALDYLGLSYQTWGAGSVLVPHEGYGGAYVGATALALLAELRYAHTSGDLRFTDQRQAWLEGLLALRLPGDGFRVLPASLLTVPYGDGEAWLALAEYHHLYPENERVNAQLISVDEALTRKYDSHFEVDFVAWGIMAASARYADTQEKSFLEFIKRQTRRFLASQQAHLPSENTCDAMEGLIDALSALRRAGEGDSVLAGEINQWLATEIPKAMGLQILRGQTVLTLPNGPRIVPGLPAFGGQFLARPLAASTRVDFTGHCLSALLKLSGPSGPSTAP